MKYSVLLLGMLLGCSTPAIKPPAPENSTFRVEVARFGTVLARGTAVLINTIKNQDNTYKYYFITAKHVIEDRIDLTDVCVQEIYLENVVVNTLRIDQIYDNPDGVDLTILEATNTSLYSPVEVDTGPIQEFEKVDSISFYLGQGKIKTDGYVGFKWRDGNEVYLIVSAPVVPGSSGGGVYRQGTNKLIGITIMVLSLQPSHQLVTNMNAIIQVSSIEQWLKGFLS